MATTILAISTLLQYMAGYRAARFALADGWAHLSRAWGLLSAALLLMAIRRTITLARALGGEAMPDPVAESVALLISLLMLAGVFLISRRLAALTARERALAREAELQQIIFDSAPGMVCFKDRDGTLVRVNRRTAELFGCSAADIEGRTLEEIWPEHAEYARIQDEQVIQRDQPSHAAEVRTRFPDGRIRWLRIDRVPFHTPDGEVGGTVVFSRDITEQRAAEQALRANESRFRALVEGTSASVGAGFLKSLTRNLADAVGARWSFVCRHLGSPPQEARILTMWDRDEGEIPEFTYPLAGTPCERVAESGYAFVREGVAEKFPEDTWLADHGVDAYLAVALVDGSGARLGHVGVLHDQPLPDDEAVSNVMRIFASRAAAEISRDDATRQHQEMEQRMQQAQRLESLGVLAGGIAHDFNNILSGIRGHAEIGRDSLSPNAPARRHFEQIENAAQQAAGLTRQMLAYAGRGFLERVPVDIPTLVQETHELIAAGVGKDVDIRLDIRDVPGVMADSSQLRQVVLNLITNAAEAVQEHGSGGVVVSTDSIHVADEELATHDLTGHLAAGEYVRITVEDSGPGMDEETLARIFDPFFSTKFQGRGLGLAAVLGIVKSHGGTISVESSQGTGTTFRVVLPTAAAPGRPVTRNPEATGTTPLEGTVLVVDDEELPRNITAELLAMQGLEVLTAESGEEALEIVEREGATLGVVLLDLTMPGIGGRATLERLSKIRPSLPVILVSGYDETEARGRVASAVAGFIQKPFAADKLTAEVRRHLAAHESRSQSQS